MSAIEIAHLTSLAGKGDEFEKQLTQAIEVLVEDSETQDIVLYRGIENPDQFTLLVTWTSVEAHEAWRAGDGRAKYRSYIENVLVLPIQVAHFNQVARRKGS